MSTDRAELSMVAWKNPINLPAAVCNPGYSACREMECNLDFVDHRVGGRDKRVTIRVEVDRESRESEIQVL